MEKGMAVIELTCPFCSEAEFDAIGLKRHFLLGWCDVFNDTPDTDRLTRSGEEAIENHGSAEKGDDRG